MADAHDEALRTLNLLAQGDRGREVELIGDLHDVAAEAIAPTLAADGSVQDVERAAVLGRVAVEAVLDRLGPDADARELHAARSRARAPLADDADVTILELRVDDWHVIDGSLDTTASVDRVEGASIDGRCERIREAGWAASRQHPDAGAGAVGWPPADATLTIALPPDDWRFVLAQVERWGTWERDDDPTAVFERRLRQIVTEL